MKPPAPLPPVALFDASAAPPPLFSLASRVALVTGGGTGIGAALAEGLAQAGARVVIAGRREGPLEATAAAILDTRACGQCQNPRSCGANWTTLPITSSSCSAVHLRDCD